MNPLARIRINLDTLSPDLAKKAAALKDLSPLALTAAEALRSWAERAFDEPSLRMTPWAPRKTGGTHPLLKKNGQLWRSFVASGAGQGKAKIVSDRPYAAAHQFGSAPYIIRPKTKKALWWPGLKHPVKMVRHPGLPARPFFPVNAQGQVMPAAQAELLEAAEMTLRGLLGIGGQA